eukprot:1917852-Rhodomonas_salina.1
MPPRCELPPSVVHPSVRVFRPCFKPGRTALTTRRQDNATVEPVEKLLKIGADPNFQDPNVLLSPHPSSCFHPPFSESYDCAARPTIWRMMADGRCVCLGQTKCTPLHLAAMHGNTQLAVVRLRPSSTSRQSSRIFDMLLSDGRIQRSLDEEEADVEPDVTLRCGSC